MLLAGIFCVEEVHRNRGVSVKLQIGNAKEDWKHSNNSQAGHSVCNHSPIDSGTVLNNPEVISRPRLGRPRDQRPDVEQNPPEENTKG